MAATLAASAEPALARRARRRCFVAHAGMRRASPRRAGVLGPTAVCWAALLAFLAVVQAQDADEALERYAPKNCKYNLVPHTLSSRAYTTATGEVRVNDVFGLPSTVKRHVIQVQASGSSLLTLQAEVHRDTPATVAVDVYRRGFGEGAVGRILSGEPQVGSGGPDTKVFLHGLISDTNLVFDIVLEMTALEMAKAQVNSRVQASGCQPVRLDITLIPVSRAALHWPRVCPESDVMPGVLKPGSDIPVLGDEGFKLDPAAGVKHFSYRWGEDRPFVGFGQSLWDGIIEVPQRLHRFVRFFFRTSFRFASAPLQIVLELFDLKDAIDETAVKPSCALGCLGGVPVYNGQLLDHAMPTGFRYRIWLLRAQLDEWSPVVPEGRRCLEFDLDYSVKFEQGVTPFEVGPAAWLCAATRLPAKIVQTQDNGAWKEHVEGELIVGRTIWVRDHFVFPPEEVADMEHKIELTVSEPSVFRATTHEADGVDVFVALTLQGSSDRVCKAVKHPGPVPRQTIFCHLAPGKYELVFFADYPLGGLHPCGEFYAQIAVRPLSLSQTPENAACANSPSDMRALKVPTTSEIAKPMWKTIKVPVKFGDSSGTVVVWRTLVQVSKQQAAQKSYLRLVAHSDYTSADLRFQVRFGGKSVADNQLTAHGYADMIGPLDAGAYDVELYYISGSGAPKGTVLCGKSMVDLRLVLPKDITGNEATTGSWLCASTRVHLPDNLAPRPDEQTLIDSEYEIPASGSHRFTITLTERRLARVLALSESHVFFMHMYKQGSTQHIVYGQDNIQVALEPGTYTLTLKAEKKELGSSSGCRVFNFNMLLQNEANIHQCPWSPNAVQADESPEDAIQRQASDHIGQMNLDLVPQAISKDVKRAPTKALWMNIGMQKSFDLNLDTNAAVRVEVAVQPPFIPLEIVLERVHPNGKLGGNIAVGEFKETRLLLMHQDVPKGQYRLTFLQAEKYTMMDGRQESDISNLCAHASIVAEVGVASKEAVNTLRSELLDLPDLLAVQPLPSSINTVGWMATPSTAVVGTQVYRFPEGSGKASLTLDDKALLRIVSEPADLSNSNIDVRLVQGGTLITQSDALGQMVFVAEKGTYDLEMHPHVQQSPFIVTFGIESLAQLREDALLQDSSACQDKVPTMLPQGGWSQEGWTIGPTTMRLKPTPYSGTIAKIPVTISSPSVLYMEVGSELPADLVRVSIQVPEGLWIGEQRGLRNSLAIELSNGEYMIQMDQPLPAPAPAQVRKCTEFSIYLVATPMNADSKAEAASAADAAAASAKGGKQELTVNEQEAVQASSCFSSGTVPLPLDLTDPRGGSVPLGGPIDEAGRLLLRGRVLITDMHDGRKKTYIATKGKKLQMKVGVSIGGYSAFSLTNSLTFAIVNAKTKAPVEPMESWDVRDGWERIFVLEGDGFWLTFHHPHRERSASACIHFILQIEVHPMDDVPRMSQCPGTGIDPQVLLPSTLDISDTQSRKQLFQLNRPHLFLQQQPIGFLTRTAFTLTVASWVYAEVGYNFFVSHAEMDVVRASRSSNTASAPLIESHLDFIHGMGHELNARLLLGESLPPGEYVLRVADDRWKGQIPDGSTGCYPFSLDVTIVPEGAPPTVVSVLPHPSVVIPRGSDLVITLRFSEAPAGSVEEVVGKISLGGFKASLGGSVNDMSSQYVQRKTAVRVSVEEGHRVWIVSFLADALVQMPPTAKLDLGGLRSNVTNAPFAFSPPTYTFASTERVPPWSGSGSSSSSSSGVGVPSGLGGSPVPEASGSAGSVGAPRFESGSPGSGGPGAGGSDIGAPRSEGSGASVSAATAADDAVGKVNFGGTSSAFSSNKDELEGIRPKVEDWSPIVAPSTPAPAMADGCPSGTVLNPQSGICEVGGNGLPVGYNTIVVCSGVGLAAFLYFYQASPRKQQGPSARFRDIGQRSSEEELGLVHAMDMDDDML